MLVVVVDGTRILVAGLFLLTVVRRPLSSTAPAAGPSAHQFQPLEYPWSDAVALGQTRPSAFLVAVAAAAAAAAGAALVVASVAVRLAVVAAAVVPGLPPANPLVPQD